ncbi:MAG: hemerythrin domain-containing protein [Chloroflexota bacterium]
MGEAAKIIDTILAEHELIHNEFTKLDIATGDVDSAARLGSQEVKEYFVPRGLSGQQDGIVKWKAQLDAIEETLHAHFKREEVSLMEALQLEGTQELLDALNGLLDEHKDIKAQLASLHEGAKDIASGGLRIDVWDAEGWGMKHNIDSFRKMLEEHAERERVLFSDLKAQLQSTWNQGDADIKRTPDTGPQIEQ